MMMMRRVMCVLAVVLCCACGYTMAVKAEQLTKTSSDATTDPYGYRLIKATNNSNDNAGFARKIEKGQKYPLHNTWDWDSPSLYEKTAEAPPKGRTGAQPHGQDAREGVDRSTGPQIQTHQTSEDEHTTLPSHSEEKTRARQIQADGGGHDAESGSSLTGSGTPEPTQTTTGARSSEGVNSHPNEPQTVSESDPDNSSVNPGNVSQQPPPGTESAAPIDGNSGNQSTATPGTTAVSGSEETNTTIPSSPENTVSEESTVTPSRDSNLTQQSTATDEVTAAPNSQETNTTTPPITENTTTEAPTTTPSPVAAPNPEISNIDSTVQKNKPIVDSSVSPVWMRTAAPLLIVVVLFSATVY
ncbi:uncharacterized protein TM35_000581020 [Trypanosoma theileri]|uniref:Mucin TcMUCII n=1 Tax=Trypanosoma theileri TaxID=67003 RepID=A0A1X0NHT8_9TRYP|nr:uncharacterized protein TM35_000581020 [Trypanosoma theileri]ORC83739.1 hypothetical protein TM35_000581020 [Trypanosoma theileri]